jgi:hypothetical protein
MTFFTEIEKIFYNSYSGIKRVQEVNAILSKKSHVGKLEIRAK